MEATRSPHAMPAVPPAPVSWNVFVAFFSAVAIGSVSFVALAGYARKETAVGILVPVAGLVRVLPPRAGTIAALNVSEGDRVEAGQPLIVIDSTQALLGGATLEGSLERSVRRQRQLLLDQIGFEESSARSEKRRLDAAITGRIREIEALSVERAIQAQRVQLALEKLEGVRRLLEGGHAAKADERAREEDWLTQRQLLAALDRQTSASRAELDQSRTEQSRMGTESESRLAELRMALAELTQRSAEIVARGEQLVRASVRGRVTALVVRQGEIADPSRPLMTLVPEDAELRAELYVASRAIGFVKVGQRVRLMYDAFPYQRFGTYWGEVESVSSAVLAPGDVAPSIRLQEPAYRVLVRLARQSVQAFGESVDLQPNMQVTADVILEERSIAEWMLEPLLSARSRM